MSIASNIKHLREAHGMSQAEFGNIAGVTDKAVSSWETGKKEPRMGAIQKIADHFGIRKRSCVRIALAAPRKSRMALGLRAVFVTASQAEGVGPIPIIRSK